MADRSEQILESVAFLGEATGPLFLYEPLSEQAEPIYQALKTLDVEAADEWPFASAEEAREAFAMILQGLTTDEEELLWEYRRLFVGPAAKAAPPWGSVYTDRECVIFGETTLELRAWLRQVGIQAFGDGQEPEDHIGLMLLLMAWIAREHPELLEEYLRDHLLPWAPHFLEVVQRESSHQFFQGLASLTAASLAGVQDAFGLDVIVPRFYR